MTNKLTNVNSLNIFLWNANGLKSHESELLHLFIEKNIDIGLITETHCTPTSKNFFPGYNVYRVDHPDGTAHGGSAIIISIKIHCQPLINLQAHHSSHKSPNNSKSYFYNYFLSILPP